MADATVPARKLSRRVLAHVFARSFLLQAGFNPRAMQGLGYAYAVYPALRALYDGEARAQAVRRHLETFNTHPYFAAAVIGGAVRLEERAANGEVPLDAAVAFRKALGAPLAAIGDAFFWNALRPACALLAALTAPSLGLGAIAVFLVLYNVVHLTVRFWLFRIGYVEAEGLVEKVGRAQFPVGTVFLRRAAAALAGAVAAQAALVAGRHGGARGFVAAGAAALVGVLSAGHVPPAVLAYGMLALALVAALLS